MFSYYVKYDFELPLAKHVGVFKLFTIFIKYLLAVQVHNNGEGI